MKNLKDIKGYFYKSNSFYYIYFLYKGTKLIDLSFNKKNKNEELNHKITKKYSLQEIDYKTYCFLIKYIYKDSYKKFSLLKLTKSLAWESGLLRSNKENNFLSLKKKSN